MPSRSGRRRDGRWRANLSDDAPSPLNAAIDPGRLFGLFNEIGIIHQLASTAFERVLPYDLTQAQFTVLNHCVRLGDNKTPAQLADAFQVTRGTLTSTLGRLEAKGFITLTPDASDGRSKRILLTPLGRAAREEAIAAAAPLLMQAATALSADEFARLLPLLERLRGWLDANRSP